MPLPEFIGKYEIRRELGKGAMGAVYEGFDPVIKRPVAIKTILTEYLANVESDAAVARFKQEAQAGGRLQHPGIVGVYEYGEDETGAFIVMEYVQGKLLRQCMRERGCFDPIDVFEVMKQLFAALDYSHQHDVIHRDIKPTNVMVLGGMKIKIMDFGIAKIESSSLTQVGTVIGTPTHISPEQLLGLPADHRADLWSAGVILYEMLTGHGPFLAETPVAVMHKVMNVEPVPPSAIVPSLPPVFDTLLARALAKKPDKRFQSAREFNNALLAAFIRSKPVPKPSGSNTDGLLPEPVAGGARSGSAGTRSTGASTPLPLPQETLEEIESSLIRSIGPVAKHLVRKGMIEARSIEEFCATLAENVPEGVERADFLKHIERLKKAASASLPSRSPKPPEPTSATPVGVFDPATLAAAEKRLAQYVGPLARVLIKRAANDSGNVQELYRKLAEHIDSEPERAAFLHGLA